MTKEKPLCYEATQAAIILESKREELGITTYLNKFWITSTLESTK